MCERRARREKGDAPLWEGRAPARPLTPRQIHRARVVRLRRVGQLAKPRTVRVHRVNLPGLRAVAAHREEDRRGVGRKRHVQYDRILFLKQDPRLPRRRIEDADGAAPRPLRPGLPHVVGYRPRTKRRSREEEDRRQRLHLGREFRRFAPRIGRGEAWRTVREEPAQRDASRSALPRRPPEIHDPRDMPSVRQPLRHTRLLAQRRVERADGLAVHERLEEPERRGLVAEGDPPDPAARALPVAHRKGRSLELHLHGVARLLAHPRVRPAIAPRLPRARRLDERIRPRRDGRRQTRQRQH